MEFGQILRQLRKQRKLTQKELADIIFVEQTTISGYENGKIQPTAKVIIELADYFDVSTNYLLGQPEKNKNQLEQIIDSTIDELKNEDTLLFMKNGEFDENTARLLKAAIKNGIKTVDDMTKND
ncbi:helix-turn-helix domain-containing protein [Enterococcus faecalis]|uniref:helix-turn-helix domain-containing protein n=1 Tax=Enterococcus faecalis TaxID=1351 RepID=UPI0013703315|nr:helix-turn-helix transcriptional regulator [Enterococcus faecalis]NAA52642.1 helix-turn-helix domain-containing protein [Enterococcus faecalis]